MVIEMAGSSTRISGSAFGFSASASVSPIMISGMPATAMMSPGPADSAGLRSRPSVISSSEMRTRSVLPSARHQATVCPLRMVPWRTRHSASRPRKGEASRLVHVGPEGAHRPHRPAPEMLSKQGLEQRLEGDAVAGTEPSAG
jgi:hypothetical protein